MSKLRFRDFAHVFGSPFTFEEITLKQDHDERRIVGKAVWITPPAPDYSITIDTDAILMPKTLRSDEYRRYKVTVKMKQIENIKIFVDPHDSMAEVYVDGKGEIEIEELKQD